MQIFEIISYLSQREAAEVDEILMGPLGFNVDPLMELACLGVAASIAEVYKPGDYSRVLALCSPGNNGGDGLVAARHLLHFGYKPYVCYSKRTPKSLYAGTPLPPLDGLIRKLTCLRDQGCQKLPVIVSIDIPSGWHGEEGDKSGNGLKPDMLVDIAALRENSISPVFVENEVDTDPINQVEIHGDWDGQL